MSYQIVRYKRGYYATRIMVKILFQVGDSGLSALVESGKVRITRLLGCLVYQLKGEDIEARLEYIPMSIDRLDEQIACLGDECAKLDHKVRAMRLGDRYFIALENLHVPDKYRWVARQPCVRLFGKKFVAIDAASAS
jgi:hypothetical protein